MDYITITDIFKNNVDNTKDNNKLPFIVLHTFNPKCIVESTQYISTSDSIWKPNQLNIFKILQLYNINPTNFSYIGDTHYHSLILPKKMTILLVNNNKNISADPINYIEIGQYIWKPVCPQEYQGIGLIVSHTKPSLKAIKVINKKYLLECQQSIDNTDEFNLLSNINVKKYIINKNKLLHTQPNKNIYLWKTCEGKKVILREPKISWYMLKQQSNNTVNNTVNNTSNNTTNSTINNTANNTINSTANNTANSTINSTVDNTVNGTVNNTVNSTADNTINSTAANTINNTINNTVNDTSDNTVNDILDNTKQIRKNFKYNQKKYNFNTAYSFLLLVLFILILMRGGVI